MNAFDKGVIFQSQYSRFASIIPFANIRTKRHSFIHLFWHRNQIQDISFRSPHFRSESVRGWIRSVFCHPEELTLANAFSERKKKQNENEENEIWLVVTCRWIYSNLSQQFANIIACHSISSSFRFYGSGNVQRLHKALFSCRNSSLYSNNKCFWECNLQLFQIET